MLEPFIARLDPSNDAFPGEVYAAEIGGVLDDWSSSLRQYVNTAEKILGSLSPTLTATPLDQVSASVLRSDGPLRIARRSFPAPATGGRDTFSESWKRYLLPFARLEVAELQITDIRIRSESPLTVETEVRYDLTGSAGKEDREQRTGAWEIRWMRDGQSRWRVDRWLAKGELQCRLSGPGFSDITADCIDPASPGAEQLRRGVDYWRTVIDSASGLDVYGNNGIAAGDFEATGFDGLYVCEPAGLPNRLYRNRRDGTFEDITERSGTGLLDGTASALFADFSNQGRQDLLVVRTSGPLLFRNLGDGRFEPRPDAFHFARQPLGTFTSAAAADYNRDGLLDLYLCTYSYYQGLSQYQYPSPYHDAQNGPPNFLFRNRGDGSFEDVTVASGMDENNNRFSFAAAWCDYDGNGWPDLYVANDFGRKNLYRSDGDGTFRDVAAQAGVEDPGPGMSACWFDYDNDGIQDLYVANMRLMAGLRVTADERFMPGVAQPIRAMYRKHAAGNSMFRGDGHGGFVETTAHSGAGMGRWSWSSDAWDFDHDGWPDLYVANGFISGPNPHNLSSFFWRQVVQRAMVAGGASTEYELAWNAVNELLRSDYTWSGYQRNVCFANNRDGTFADVSGVLGLDFRDDSRAFALTDFDHDGRLEMVLKSRTGPQLRLLHNDMRGAGNSVAFRLKGTRSNRDAIGAMVTVATPAGRQTKFIQAGSGFASGHTRELFFGVGAAQEPLHVEVRWPSGTVQQFTGVPVNHRIEIEEGRNGFRAVPFSPARQYNPGSRPLQADTLPDRVQAWLIDPLAGPDFELPDATGARLRLSALRGAPVLLNFSRQSCDASVRQFEGLQALQRAGLRVISVDIEEHRDATVAAAQQKSGGFPVLAGDSRVAGAWNILCRYLFDRRRDLTTPTSFLLDASGAIARVYIGMVEPARVLEDSRRMPATAEDRLAKALPFHGKYFGEGIRRNYFTYGVAFVEYGYLDEALEAFQHAIAANPANAGAWFNIGTIYLNKKVYADARINLAEAIRLDPKDPDAWNNLGMVSGEEGKYADALSQFLEAIRLKPDHVLAVQNALSIYQYQGNAAAARTLLQDAVRRSPENAELRLGLGIFLMEQNELRPALEQLEECGRIAPDDDRAWINIAMVYKAGGDSEKGRQVLRKYLVRHPDDGAVRGALEQLGEK